MLTHLCISVDGLNKLFRQPHYLSTQEPVLVLGGLGESLSVAQQAQLTLKIPSFRVVHANTDLDIKMSAIVHSRWIIFWLHEMNPASRE